MRFEFATATRIIFGAGTVTEVGSLAKEAGQRALLVCGSDVQRTERVKELLRTHGIEPTIFSVAGEPTIETALEGVELGRSNNCDLVIGFGGGSSLDSGKAIAALLTNGGQPLDYLEVIGRGQPIVKPSAPFIAIPTTAGTGAEVTRNAVLGSIEHRVKVSLRSPLMLPRVAIVDPELTYGIPPGITAGTGLDALTQVMEPFVSGQSNPLTDGLCREGLQRAARSLKRACDNGQDAAARNDMALTSLFGGLALANAKLGAVHGFAGPFGGMFHAPHGATCAALLPHVMAMNVQAMQAREPDNPSLERYDEIGVILTDDPLASAEDAIEWVQQLCAELHIPPLRTYGLSREDFPALIDKSAKASSMKGNPIQLTDSELRTILDNAL